MELNPSRIVILTGAGFTKDFGGFLGKEMWENIFSHKDIQENENLRAAMVADPECNYETILYNVQNGSYSQEDKESLYQVVEQAYALLDKSIYNYCENRDQAKGISLRGVFGMFTGALSESDKKHFIFTLNQDLLMERAGSHRSPFVDLVGHNQMKLGAPFRSEYCVTLPTEEELEQRKEQFVPYGAWHYVKLHGSYGWTSATGGRGMVLGKNKTEAIQQEPLLRLNYQMFKDVLASPDRLLIIIGYGFGDQHINDVIVDSVINHGLKLYIITPSEAPTLLEKLNGISPSVGSALSGCSLKPLRELFPYGGDYRTTHKDLFQRWEVI